MDRHSESRGMSCEVSGREGVYLVMNFPNNGEVSERIGGGLQNRLHGFESHPCLHCVSAPRGCGVEATRDLAKV